MAGTFKLCVGGVGINWPGVFQVQYLTSTGHGVPAWSLGDTVELKLVQASQECGPTVAATIRAVRRHPIPPPQPASFRVTLAEEAPEGGVTVNVLVSETGDAADDVRAVGDHLAAANERTWTVKIAEGETRGYLHVPTVKDRAPETNSTIEATLQPGTGYTVGDRSQAEQRMSAFIPVASVEPVSPSVREGQYVWFRFKLTGDRQHGDRLVYYELSETGGSGLVYPGRAGLAFVTIPNGATEQAIGIPTVRDATPESGGAVTVKLVLNPVFDGYYDLPKSETGLSASVTVNDFATPTAYLRPAASPVMEGEPAGVRVVLSSPAPAGGVDVWVDVAGATRGVVLASGERSRRKVTVPGGATEATFSVATVDDTTPWNSGHIIVYLYERAPNLRQTGYLVDPADYSTWVAVTDNDGLPAASPSPAQSYDAVAGQPFSGTLPATSNGEQYVLWDRETGLPFRDNGLTFDRASRMVSGTPEGPQTHELVYVAFRAPPGAGGASGPDDGSVEQTAVRIEVRDATNAAGPSACMAELGALSAGAEPVWLEDEAWDAPECRAHHREDRPARYFSFTLDEPAMVSLALTSDSAASLFVSKGTPKNGWGAAPKGTMEHRLKTRRANGRLVHEAATSASLALEAGSYTAEAVLDEDGADPAAASFGLRIEAADPGAGTADTAPTVSDTSAFANHEAVVGEAFSLTLPAADEGSGNGGPYAYALHVRGGGADFADGIDGLVFDPETRTLSGTPERAGVHELSYTVHDGDANTDDADAFRESESLQVTVRAAPPVAGGAPTVSDTSAFANHHAVAGEAFSLTLPAADAGSGDGGPYAYILWKRGAGVHFGENGLSFDPATRTVTGTPRAAGAFDLAYQVHDGDADRGLADSFVEETALRITVVPGGAPVTLSVFSAAVGEDAGTVGVLVLASRTTDGLYRCWAARQDPRTTATPEVDFTAARQRDAVTLDFSAQRTGTFPVTVLDDSVAEPEEAVTVRCRPESDLSDALGGADGLLTIVDDDDPAVSVADARADESDGTIAFAVTLDLPARERATVSWATADGTALAGEDYAAASGTLTFLPGESAKTVEIGLLDDAHDEGEETFRLVLSDPVNLQIGDGEAVGTIVNSDPALNAWLARFGRTVAGQTVAALTERFAVPPGAASHVTLGGQRLALTASDTGAATDGGDAGAAAAPDADAFAALASRDGRSDGGPGPVSGATALPGSGVIPGSGAVPGSAETQTMTGREFLLGSSFHLTSDGKQSGTGRWTAWGRAALERFSGRDGGLTVDGEVATGVFGADWDAGRWLGGVALTHSIGEGELRPENMPLGYDVESTVTAVNPYLRLQLTERVSAWGVAGYGGGELELTVKREASDETPASERTYRTDLTMTLGALGARGELVTPEESGGYGLALRGDAFWVRTESDAVTVAGVGRLAASEGEASRVRLTLEGSRRIDLEGGALTPSLEVGLRQDGGDAETGTGLELGGGLAYADPASGLSMDLRARTLVAHAESGYREWGVSGAVKLQPGGAGRGLSFSLLPAFGADAGGDRIWSARDAAALAPVNENADPKGRLEAEIGYGLPAFGGGFTGTPYLGFGSSDTERKYRLGWRLTRPAGAGSFAFTLEASRRETANDNEPEHGIGFRATARW